MLIHSTRAVVLGKALFRFVVIYDTGSFMVGRFASDDQLSPGLGTN